MNKDFVNKNRLFKLASTTAAVCSLAFALPAVAAGGVTPAGLPFSIDSLDASVGMDDSAVTAMAADGSAVVAWTITDAQGESTVIMARRVAKDGTPLTDDIVVDVPLGGGALDEPPRVASDAAGNFAVIWEADSGEGSNFSAATRLRIFNADGTPRMDPVCVAPDCTGLPGGVVMSNSGQVTVLTSGSAFVNMLYQFNADGSARTAMPVSVDNSNALNSDSLAINRQTGTIAIASLQVNSTNGQNLQVQHSLVRLQRYDAEAGAVGPATTVFGCNFNTFRGFIISGCAVQGLSLAEDDAGNTLVAWRETDMKGKAVSDRVYARGYASSGKALGSKQALSPESSTTAEIYSGTGVVAGPTGRFMVTWPIMDQSHGDVPIRSNLLQEVAPDGTLNGVSSTVIGNLSAGVSANSAGDLLAVCPGNFLFQVQPPGVNGQFFSFN